MWKDHPTQTACASCHDDTYFGALPAPTGMVAHPGGPQPTDVNCSVCHTANPGGLESITTKHYTVYTDPAANIIAATFSAVSNTAPGQTPEVVFAVTKDGVPLDILANPLTSLSLTMAGPTTDFATFVTYKVQGAGSVGTLAADPGGFRYTFPAPIDPAATGSIGLALEGYLQVGGSTAPRYSMMNPITYAAVTDPSPVDRRSIVTTGQCNSCHDHLEGHGGSRRAVEYCSFCHNPNKVNDQRVASFEGLDAIAQSVDLRTMIHKIHMGDKLTHPYVLGGFPAPSATNPAGTPNNFGEVGYPGDQRSCGTCHVAGSVTLPLADNLLPTHQQTLTCTEDPVADGDSFCNTRIVSNDQLTGPTASACLACHDEPSTRAHALTNTDSPSGVEACATCHGPGDAFDAAIGHQLDP